MTVVGRSFTSTVDTDLARLLVELLIANGLRIAEMRFAMSRSGLVNPTADPCVDFTRTGPGAIDALGTLIEDIAA